MLPGELRGKRVLELGAGTGVAGLAAALLGAQVTARWHAWFYAVACLQGITTGAGSCTPACKRMPGCMLALLALAGPSLGRDHQPLPCAKRHAAGLVTCQHCLTARTAQVTLTDLPAALPLLRRNAAALAGGIAAAGGSASVAELDWSRVEECGRASGSAPERTRKAAGDAAASSIRCAAGPGTGDLNRGLEPCSGRAAHGPAACAAARSAGRAEQDGPSPAAEAHGAGACADALCGAPYALLLGADLVYTQAAVAPLASTIAHVLHGSSSRVSGEQHPSHAGWLGSHHGARPTACGVLLAHKDRHERVTASLMAALAGLGLVLEPVGVSARSPAVRVFRSVHREHSCEAVKLA